MRKTRVILRAAAAGVVAVAASAQFVRAADSYSWVPASGGVFNWTDAGNWVGTAASFPQNPQDQANIQIAATGNTSITIGSAVTVGTLALGATGSPLTIDVGNANAGGGTLIFDSFDPAVTNSGGTSSLVSGGAAGAVNVISAPVQFTNYGGSIVTGGTNGTASLLISGTNNLTISSLTIGTDANAADGTLLTQRVILNGLTNGTLTLGDVALSQAGAAASGTLQLNAASASSGMSYVLNGVISNGGISGGRVIFGNNATSVGNSGTASPTFYINNANTYTGNTVLGRGTFVLNNDQPFGLINSVIGQASPANTWFTNIVSSSDSRILPNLFQLQQHIIFSGTHSLSMTGGIFQTNGRDLVNNLASDKTLNINGFVSPVGSTDTSRNITFDGTGTTDINGPIYNHRNPWTFGNNANDQTETASTGGIIKRGTGILVLNPTNTWQVGVNAADNTPIFGPTSTYKGPTIVQGGLLQFQNSLAYGSLASDYTIPGGTQINYPNGSSFTIASGGLTVPAAGGTSMIVVADGGAVGLVSGSTSDAGFLAKLGASTLNGGNTGALALSSADAAANIDFTTGAFAGANLVNMSVGALNQTVNYTGTITPAANGYKLGGGGTLTLPNANQLTGPRDVTITNGGTVRIAASNNYTGVTTIRGNYVQTDQVYGTINAATNNFGAAPYAVRADSTLAVTNLGDGGADSSIGSSSSAAGNLVISGGTLSYVGAGGSSDRLFTISPVGATLDASGTGAIHFTNTGAVALTDAGPRAGTLQTGANGNAKFIAAVGDVSDLTPGMTVTATDSANVGTYLPAGTSITGLNNVISNAGLPLGQIAISNNAAAGLSGATLTFGNQNRTLNLTGSNSGDNTIAAALSDSAAGQLAITKSGAGRWVLNGNNTYTGVTTVNGGSLQLGPGAQAPVLTGAGGANIAAGRIVFDYTGGTDPAATVKSLLTTSYNGGGTTAFSTGQIRSSTANANQGLGWKDDTASSKLTVAAALYGDADVSGKVDLTDFTFLASNFNGTNKNWQDGDFNYDGKVDLTDFTFLAGNFNKSLSADAAGAASLAAGSVGSLVPEPSTIAMVFGAVATGGLRRRRGRRAD